jgi:hypothetical protein
MQDGDNALLEIAIHFCQSERRSGDKIACPPSAGAVNVGDATPGLRAAFRKLLLGTEVLHHARPSPIVCRMRLDVDSLSRGWPASRLALNASPTIRT